MHQNTFGGQAPPVSARTLWGSLQRSPSPPIARLKGEEREKGGEEGKGARKGEGLPVSEVRRRLES